MVIVANHSALIEENWQNPRFNQDVAAYWNVKLRRIRKLLKAWDRI